MSRFVDGAAGRERVRDRKPKKNSKSEEATVTVPDEKQDALPPLPVDGDDALRRLLDMPDSNTTNESTVVVRGADIAKVAAMKEKERRRDARKQRTKGKNQELSDTSGDDIDQPYAGAGVGSNDEGSDEEHSSDREFIAADDIIDQEVRDAERHERHLKRRLKRLDSKGGKPPKSSEDPDIVAARQSLYRSSKKKGSGDGEFDEKAEASDLQATEKKMSSGGGDGTKRRRADGKSTTVDDSSASRIKRRKSRSLASDEDAEESREVFDGTSKEKAKNALLDEMRTSREAAKATQASITSSSSSLVKPEHASLFVLPGTAAAAPLVAPQPSSTSSPSLRPVAAAAAPPPLSPAKPPPAAAPVVSPPLTQLTSPTAPRFEAVAQYVAVRLVGTEITTVVSMKDLMAMKARGDISIPHYMALLKGMSTTSADLKLSGVAPHPPVAAAAAATPPVVVDDVAALAAAAKALADKAVAAAALKAQNEARLASVAIKEEAERKRKAEAEEEAERKRKVEEEAARKKREEEELRRKREAEEKKRIEEEAERKRIAAEAERKRKAEEEEKEKTRRAEESKQKALAKQAERKAAADAKRIADAAAEQARQIKAAMDIVALPVSASQTADTDGPPPNPDDIEATVAWEMKKLAAAAVSEDSRPFPVTAAAPTDAPSIADVPAATSGPAAPAAAASEMNGESKRTAAVVESKSTPDAGARDMATQFMSLSENVDALWAKGAAEMASRNSGDENVESLCDACELALQTVPSFANMRTKLQEVPKGEDAANMRQALSLILIALNYRASETVASVIATSTTDPALKVKRVARWNDNVGAIRKNWEGGLIETVQKRLGPDNLRDNIKTHWPQLLQLFPDPLEVANRTTADGASAMSNIHAVRYMAIVGTATREDLLLKVKSYKLVNLPPPARVRSVLCSAKIYLSLPHSNGF